MDSHELATIGCLCRSSEMGRWRQAFLTRGLVIREIPRPAYPVTFNNTPTQACGQETGLEEINTISSKPTSGPFWIVRDAETIYKASDGLLSRC